MKKITSNVLSEREIPSMPSASVRINHSNKNLDKKYSEISYSSLCEKLKFSVSNGNKQDQILILSLLYGHCVGIRKSLGGLSLSRNQFLLRMQCSLKSLGLEFEISVSDSFLHKQQSN